MNGRILGRAAAVSAIAFLAACSGGGGGTSPVPANPAQGTSNTTPASTTRQVLVTFKLPASSGSSSTSKAHTKFYSPSIAGAIITAYSGANTPNGAGATIYSRVGINFGTGGSSTNPNPTNGTYGCTSSGGSTTCMFPVPVSPSTTSVNFEFDEYDTAQNSTQNPYQSYGPTQAGVGNELGIAYLIGQNVAVSNNTATFMLPTNVIVESIAGVPAAAKVYTNPTTTDGTQTDGNVAVILSAFDADGNLIATDKYADPITLAVAEPANADNLSNVSKLALDGGNFGAAVTVQSTTDTVALAYAPPIGGEAFLSPAQAPYEAQINATANGVALSGATTSGTAPVTGYPGLFTPIYLEPASNDPEYTANDPTLGPDGKTALNYPIVNIAPKTTPVSVSPVENGYTGSFTATPSSGCQGVATVSPTSGTTFAITPGSTVSGRPSATSVTSCTITFTDSTVAATSTAGPHYQGSALLEVTNSSATSAPLEILNKTLFVTHAGTNVPSNVVDVDFYDNSGLQQYGTLPGDKVNPGPVGVAHDSNNNLYTATASGELEQYAFANGTLGGPTGIATLSGPATGLVIDKANHIYVSTSNAITAYSPSGTVLGSATASNSGPFTSITNLAIDSRGYLYAVDAVSQSNTVIDVLDPTALINGTAAGAPTVVTTEPVPGPVGAIAVDAFDSIFLSFVNQSTVFFLPQQRDGTYALTPTSENTSLSGSPSNCVNILGLAVDGADNVFADCRTSTNSGVNLYTVNMITGTMREGLNAAHRQPAAIGPYPIFWYVQGTYTLNASSTPGQMTVFP